MSPTTPDLPGQEALGPLASRYVKAELLPWRDTRYPGVELKVLFEDAGRGLVTALFRWAPGSELPFHEHRDIEQTYVLEGTLVDEEGEAGPGDFVWRPAGSRHVAGAPKGALLLAVFLQPNRFFDEQG